MSAASGYLNATQPPLTSQVFLQADLFVVFFLILTLKPFAQSTLHGHHVGAKHYAFQSVRSCYATGE